MTLARGTEWSWEAENGGARREAGPGALAASRFTGGPQTADAFESLRNAVTAACAAEAQWQEKIGAGVRAVLEFAAREPQAARGLTARAENPNLCDAVSAYFSTLLANASPDPGPFPAPIAGAMVESVTGVIRAHLCAGTTDRLPGLAPELTLLALLPYTGSWALTQFESGGPTVALG